MPINKNAWKRFTIIDGLLCNKMKPYPTMTDIIEACRAQDLDPSMETIQKDIAQMRMSRPDGFEAPIQFNRRHLGYEYTDKSYSISGIPLTEADKATIQESIELIRAIGGTSISNKFNFAMEKVLSTVLEEFPKGDAKQYILQTMTPPKSRGFEHFDLFYKACWTKTPVSFVHYSYKKRIFNAITIHPFLIKEFENKWYILGFSESHNEVRTFGLDRVYDPFLLRKSFVSVDRKIVESSTLDYYGVFPIPNQKKQKIKILVSALGTNYFEAYPIHESQKIKKEPGGFSYITFQLVPTLELTRLFLSQGHHVQLIEPIWLIDFTEKLK